MGVPYSGVEEEDNLKCWMLSKKHKVFLHYSTARYWHKSSCIFLFWKLLTGSLSRKYINGEEKKPKIQVKKKDVTTTKAQMRIYSPALAFFCDEIRIILDKSWIHQHYQYSGLHIHPEIDFQLNYTHVVNSTKSQNQTCMMLLQYGWPYRQRLGKRPENRCPTNDGQHSSRRSWESSSF